MNMAEFQALSPLVLVALTAVVAMLLAGFCRDRQLLLGWYQFGLLLALLSLPWALPQPGLDVTPLLRIDGFFGFFAPLFILVAMVLGLMSARHFGRDGQQVRAEESYVLLAVCLLGALVLSAARHFAALFIGLELMSVASFALVAYPCGAAPGRDPAQPNSLEAGLKYLLLSAVASCFLLFGIGCLYLQSGTLDFAPLRETGEATLLLPGLALLLIGIAFKLALVPFHLWSPDVYQGAPTPITALVSTLSKGALVAVLLRYLHQSGALQFAGVVAVLSVLAVLSMLAGNLLALRQNDIKRLLAYSSIAHLGYLLVVLLAVGGSDGGLPLQAGAFYVLAYSLTTLGAFAVIACVSDGAGRADYRLEAYSGLMWRAPWLGGSFILILLSLAGIPLTVGFIGKFYIFAAGVRAELWWLLGALIVGSAIGLYYYLRIILLLLAQGPAAVTPHSGLWLVYGLTLLLLLLGIYPLPVMQWLPLL